MKTLSIFDRSKTSPNIHSENILFDRGSRLPLSQQAQLASDALIVSRVLELINDIERAPENTREIDFSKFDNGIQIIERLKKGEDYVNQRKISLIQRPESADTVGHIIRRTGLHIGEKSEIVVTVLTELKNWPRSQTTLDPEKLELTKNFLRDIHTGIMDQLEASDEIDFGVEHL
jgi:hypothetical protein